MKHGSAHTFTFVHGSVLLAVALSPFNGYAHCSLSNGQIVLNQLNCLPKTFRLSIRFGVFIGDRPEADNDFISHFGKFYRKYVKFANS